MMKLLVLLGLQGVSSRALYNKPEYHHPCENMVKTFNEGRHHCDTMIKTEDALEAIDSGYKCRMAVDAAIKNGHACMTDKPILGADRDEFGCIGSAGYSWCNYTKSCTSANELCIPIPVPR